MADKTKTTYTLGIKIESKEHYDNLMARHSEEQKTMFLLTGLDLKRLFDGYPDGYPCLVQYELSDNPLGVMMNRWCREIVEDGYTVVIEQNK